MQEAEEAAAKEAEADRFFAELDTDNDGTVSVAELQVRQAFDTNKDGIVSEEEVRFFLSGADSFDRESFRLTGFLLVKPYLLQQQKHDEIAAPPAENEGLGEAEEATEAPPSPFAENDGDVEVTTTTPEVYDPWRANQQKETEVNI
jgi:protein kinase C substrate 80K-H